jgi:hypothetical protein
MPTPSITSRVNLQVDATENIAIPLQLLYEVQDRNANAVGLPSKNSLGDMKAGLENSLR